MVDTTSPRGPVPRRTERPWEVEPLPGGAATVFTRVGLVAPRMRVDVALPTDVSVADLLPTLLEMVRETGPDGGAGHGGWCLARIGRDPLDPVQTLAQARVLDGELLQLRRRSQLPPPPLFDDVIDAIALSTPTSYHPWTAALAGYVGMVAAAAALLAAAASVYLAGPGWVAAVAAALVAALGVGVAAVLSRVYEQPRAAALLGSCALPFVFVAGLYAVPDGPAPPNLLFGAVAVTVAAVGSVLLLATGLAVFIAAATLGTLGAGAALVALQIAHPYPGIGAGLAAAALVALSATPRLTIQLARLPLPAVPISPRELADDDDAAFPDLVTVQRRAARAHTCLTGLLLGCAAAATLGALLAARGGTSGIAFAATVGLVLMLRARTYANGLQSLTLLVTGLLVAGGLVVGWLVAADAVTRSVWISVTLVVAAAVALLLGGMAPGRRFSPPVRRAVEILEAVAIAAVLPLALAVLNLYATMRGL